MMPLVVGRARREDTSAILRLLDEAARWLQDRGVLDQWSVGDFPVTKIARDIAAGNVVTMRDNGSVVAALTMDRDADPEFWRSEDDPGSALYVHRLVVCRSLAGRGVGAGLLAYVAVRAASLGRRRLRLDCAKRNHDLHRYYKSQGFQHLRTVDLAHRRSGALFQRDVLHRCPGDLSRA